MDGNLRHILAVSRSESASRNNLVRVARGGGRPLNPPTPKRRRYRQPVKAGPIHPNLAVLYSDYIQIGWSLSRYAEDRLGVTRQTVAYWFNGKKYPSPALAERIRARTGIVIPTLMNGEWKPRL